MDIFAVDKFHLPQFVAESFLGGLSVVVLLTIRRWEFQD